MPQGDQLARHPRIRRMLDQQVAPLAGLHRWRRGQHALEVAEFADQLRRRLRADARHPRHVVDAVADQRLRVDQLLRRHAEFLHHLGRPDRLLLHRVEHVDARADQLHQILVGRDDRRPPPGRHRQIGIGRDQVVGLPVGQLDRRHAEGRRRVAHQDELRRELGRRLRPMRLVLVIQPVAEGGAPGIEDDGEMGAEMILQQFRQHVGEAEHRIHRRPIGPRHRRQRMKGAEDEPRPVNEYQVRRPRRRRRQAGLFFTFRLAGFGYRRVRQGKIRHDQCS